MFTYYFPMFVFLQVILSLNVSELPVLLEEPLTRHDIRSARACGGEVAALVQCLPGH